MEFAPQNYFKSVLILFKVIQMFLLGIFTNHSLREYTNILVYKPLSAAGILGDNAQGWKIAQKMNSWLRSKASRATGKFWAQSFSLG